MPKDKNMSNPVQIHPTAKVSHLADIEPSVRGTKIIIGPECRIDSFVKIKPVGGTGDVVIGKGCSINSGTVIYTGGGVTMGEYVLIASNCTIAPVNHQYRRRDIYIDGQGFLESKGGIVIEDDVWIGAGSVILDGAILRKGCVVGAGSIVNSELPEYSINMGVPAKTVGYRG